MPPWFIFTALAVFCWGLWAVISKLLGESITAAQSQALSTLGLLPVMLALMRNPQRIPSGNRCRGRVISFVAGLLSALGNLAYYQALNSGGKAATVVSLTAMYPLVTIALAVGLLHERLNLIQRCGIVLSLVSIYFFNIPNVQSALNPFLIVAMIPILLWGVSAFLQKLSTRDLSGEASALWFLLAFLPVAGCLLWYQPLSESISVRTWLLAIGLGLFFSLGNYAMLLAFAKNGKASIIVPLSGLYPIVSVPIAILFLGEKINSRETAGIVFALLSVAALSYEKPSIPTPAP